MAIFKNPFIVYAVTIFVFKKPKKKKGGGGGDAGSFSLAFQIEKEKKRRQRLIEKAKDLDWIQDADAYDDVFRNK